MTDEAGSTISSNTGSAGGGGSYGREISAGRLRSTGSTGAGSYAAARARLARGASAGNTAVAARVGAAATGLRMGSRLGVARLGFGGSLTAGGAGFAPARGASAASGWAGASIRASVSFDAGCNDVARPFRTVFVSRAKALRYRRIVPDGEIRAPRGGRQATGGDEPQHERSGSHTASSSDGPCRGNTRTLDVARFPGENSATRPGAPRRGDNGCPRGRTGVPAGPRSGVISYGCAGTAVALTRAVKGDSCAVCSSLSPSPCCPRRRWRRTSPSATSSNCRRRALGEPALLALIDVNGTVFPVDVDTLRTLKDEGVSPAVIIAMIRSGRTPPPPPLPVPQPLQLATPAPPPAQVVVIEHRDEPRVREVAVPVPVYVPVPVRRTRFDDDGPVRPPVVRKPVEPVYWGWGGKLRPDAWKPTTVEDIQPDAKVPRPQKK